MGLAQLGLDKLLETEETIKAAEAIEGGNEMINELKKSLIQSKDMAGDDTNPDRAKIDTFKEWF